MIDSLRAKTGIAVSRTVADSGAHALGFPWPERYDQWVIWGAGLLIAGLIWLAQFLGGRGRREFLVTLLTENKALLVLLNQLDTFLSGNPHLPDDGVRTLGYRLAALDAMRERVSLLKREEVLEEVLLWFDALHGVQAHDNTVRELDLRMREAADFREHLKPLKIAQNALREHLAKTLQLTEGLRKRLLQERHGWKLRFVRDEAISIPEAPWARIERGPLGVQVHGTITSAYVAASSEPVGPSEQEARAKYSAKRMLDRVIAAVSVAGVGGTGTEISPTHLDEIGRAVADFEANAIDLHSVADAQLRDELSAFAVRLRIELKQVEAREASVAARWAEAHAKQAQRKSDLDYWFKVLLPPVADYSARNRVASIEQVNRWGESAAMLLERLDR